MMDGKKFEENARKSTRYAKVSSDDQKYLDANFIDSYYSKKKKNKFNTEFKNAPMSPTKIKFLTPALEELPLTPKDTSNGMKKEEIIEELSEIKNLTYELNELHPPIIHICDGIKKFEKNEKIEADEEVKVSDCRIKDEVKMEHKEKIANKIFYVESGINNTSESHDKNENNGKNGKNDTTKAAPKKRSKQYLELLENSILVFDKPKREKFSVIKPINYNEHMDEQQLKSFEEATFELDLKLSEEEKKLNLMTFATKSSKVTGNKKKVWEKLQAPIAAAFNISKEPKEKMRKPRNSKKEERNSKMAIPNNDINNNQNLMIKNISSNVIIKNFNEDSFFLLPIIRRTDINNNNSQDQDLLKIYSEIREIRFLGKKRNYHSFLYKPMHNNTNSDKNDFDIYASKKITFNKYSTKDSIITKSLLKSNFMNPSVEKKLKETLSVLQENSNHSSNKTAPSNTFSLETVVNPFDQSLRREFANSLDFIQTFQEEYAPIQMQKENERLFQAIPDNMSINSSTTNTLSRLTNLSDSKSHFIRKKQSALNIKRQCGVSYVVPSESRQLDVSDRYKPLGHLVYQGTCSVNQVQEENIFKYIENLITKELMNKPLVVTTFGSPDEDEMKDYLLFPQKRLNIAKHVFLIKSLDDIWKFIKEKNFFVIHLLLDQNEGVRTFTKEELLNFSNAELLISSDIQIGILFRKATSGIKSVLKLYKSGGLDKIKHSSTFKLCNIDLEENIDFTIERLSGFNMNTLSMRIELFTPEEKWKKSNNFTKEFLFTFISQVEDRISNLILNWNEYRNTMYSLSKEENVTFVRDYISNNHKCYTLTENNKEVGNCLNNVEFALDKKVFIAKDDSISIISENEKLITTFLIQQGRLTPFQDKHSLSSNLIFSNPPLPMYIISTRDCFVFDLKVKSEEILINNRKVIKREYFFEESNVPSNFFKFKTDKDDLRVGATTYENFYSNEDLTDLEKLVEQTEEYSLKDAFLPETAQKTLAGEKLKRTKFFFGSRYMWTKKQLAEPNSYVAAGIRKDVSPAPFWMKEKIEEPMVKAGIVEKDFINSYALNVYHDGTEGLAQHFDDAVRFKQPIYTLRLFSDCRLSFGSQLYGYCNGAFTIPLPRGCICVMEENSYASNGVKHCIRPTDMTGKSSALIMRQMHPNMVSEAQKYDFYVDFPSWFSSLSLSEDSVPFSHQKCLESEFLIKLSEMEKKSVKVNNTQINQEVVDTVNDILSSFDFYSSYDRNLLCKKKGRKAKNDY